jgi:hypothetical protein
MTERQDGTTDTDQPKLFYMLGVLWQVKNRIASEFDWIENSQ